MKTLTRVLSVAMTLSLGSQLTACTDQQVATAIGAGAIIAGAAVIAANSECVGGYRNVCHEVCDYWGRTTTECREVYDSCLYTQIKGITGLGPVEATADSVATDVNWGAQFALSFDSSAKLLDALKAARDKKDISGLKALGLKNKDLKNLGNYQLPTEKGLDALAKSLDQQPKATQLMLEQILTEAQVRAATQTQ